MKTFYFISKIEIIDEFEKMKNTIHIQIFLFHGIKTAALKINILFAMKCNDISFVYFIIYKVLNIQYNFHSCCKQFYIKFVIKFPFYTQKFVNWFVTAILKG